MKLSKEYNLAVLYPDIAKEWHPTKNGDLIPENFFPMSGKRMWWICKHGHEWKTGIRHRTVNKSNCPYCSNQKVGYGNDLQSNFPQIAKQWHPTKNRNLVPAQFALFSGKKVWWICNIGHSWETTIIHRTKNLSNCPSCSLQTSKPELFFYSELTFLFKKVYHRKKINGNEIDIFIEDINLGIEYDGSRYHKNKLSFDKKKRVEIKKSGVSLIALREEPLKKIFEEDIIIKSSTNYLKNFLFFLNHLLKSRLLNQKHNKIISEYIEKGTIRNSKFFHDLMSYLPGPMPGESLESIHPEIAKEWHPTKNGKMKPSNVHKSSSLKFWWLCKNGHEFKESPDGRFDKNRGVKKCKFCKSLSFKYPEIAKEWHKTKNRDLTPLDVFGGSGKKAWFTCEEDHDFESSISNRTSLKRGCPYCTNRKIGYGNDLLTRNPRLAKEWHPTKNGDLTPSQVFPHYNKKVWWLCKDRHSFFSTVNHRSNGTNCPKCYKISRGIKCP